METVRVLVVDDDQSTRFFLTSLLTRKKFVVDEAAGGKEALEKASFNRPDIILLDVTMPQMDGFETCRQLKKNDKTKDIPIIFCTARQAGEVVAENVDFDGYLEKPFEIDVLCKKIAEVLETDKARKQPPSL